MKRPKDSSSHYRYMDHTHHLIPLSSSIQSHREKGVRRMGKQNGVATSLIHITYLILLLLTFSLTDY